MLRAHRSTWSSRVGLQKNPSEPAVSAVPVFWVWLRAPSSASPVHDDDLILTPFPRSLLFPAWRPLQHFGESFLQQHQLGHTDIGSAFPQAQPAASSGTTHPHTGMAQEGKWTLLNLAETTTKYLCNYSDIFISKKATPAYHRLREWKINYI